MSDFIVEIVDGRGNRSFAIVQAENASDARNRVKIAGLGYTAQQVYPNTQAGFNDLSNQSAALRDSGLKWSQLAPFGTMPDRSDWAQPEVNSTKGQGGFGGEGSDGLGGASDSLANLPSVFREFLRGTGINPNSALGGQARNLQNPLQNMLDLAGAANINPFIPGQAAPQQGAQAFLEQRGLQGVGQGASNLIKQLAGVGQVNAGTQEFLQPVTEGDEGASVAKSAMLAALYKMAPTYAARFGAGAIDRAADSFFDQRRQNPQTPPAAGEFSEENMIRYIRDQFGGTGIFG